MSAIYDSGWVPVAAGTLSKVIDTGKFTRIQLIFAASGSSNAGTTTAWWVGGADTLVPPFKGNAPYLTSPRPTGTLAVAAPTAGQVNSYVLADASGTSGWIGWPYSNIGFSTIAGSGSYVRVIVDGK